MEWQSAVRITSKGKYWNRILRNSEGCERLWGMWETIRDVRDYDGCEGLWRMWDYEGLWRTIQILCYLSRFRRATHVTPKSYLSFINGYKTVYSLKRKEIGELGSRMNTGLDKLMEASESVAELSKQLAVKEKELAIASQRADTVKWLVCIRTLN